jgi:hypothetical protein
MHRLFAPVALAVCLFSTTSAHAQVNVTIETTGDGQAFADALGISIQELETEITDEINAVYNVLQAEEYLQALADAQAFSNKGLGVDYASNPTFITFGLAANATVAFGDDGFREAESDQPVANLSPNISFMVGANLNALGRPKLNNLTIFANGFSYKTNFTDEVEGRITNVGLHVQYKLFRRPDKLIQGIIRWGGLDLTAGVEYARLGISLEKDEIESELELDGGQARFDGVGTLDLDTETWTVPFEVSSNLRLLKFITLFGGTGIDIQMGGNEMDVNLDGTLTGIDPNDQSETEIGTANVSVLETAGPNRGKMRFFGGIQANILIVRASLQLNVAPDRAVGLTFALRGAW